MHCDNDNNYDNNYDYDTGDFLSKLGEVERSDKKCDKICGGVISCLVGTMILCLGGAGVTSAIIGGCLLGVPVVMAAASVGAYCFYKNKSRYCSRTKGCFIS